MKEFLKATLIFTIGVYVGCQYMYRKNGLTITFTTNKEKTNE